MIRIVSVKFRTAGKQYDFGCNSLELAAHDQVIVETDRGQSLGTVVSAPRECKPGQAPDKLKNVLRLATANDKNMAKQSEAKEKTAFEFCQARIQSRNMDMKLVRAEYLFDASKIIFYFTADGRVDFRDLVKDLAHHFHTRIEMRQIGVRDEAKITGGLGICGRALCCCTFLVNFAPVSVKMAKEQNLALNPNKISGQCGRLLCCLNYEYETYKEHRKGLPKCGRKVMHEGLEGMVVAHNVLARKVTVRREDNVSLEVPVEQLEVLDKSAEKQPSPPPKTRSRQNTSRRQSPRKPANAQETKDREATPQPKPAEVSDGDKPARKKSRRRPRRRPANSKPSGDKNG
jgi:cell fate regulator YaaT (PSP1 superfamily)